MGERLNSLSLVGSYSEVSNTTIWKVIITLIYFEKNRVLTFTVECWSFQVPLGNIVVALSRDFRSPEFELGNSGVIGRTTIAIRIT